MLKEEQHKLKKLGDQRYANNQVPVCITLDSKPPAVTGYYHGGRCQCQGCQRCAQCGFTRPSGTQHTICHACQSLVCADCFHSYPFLSTLPVRVNLCKQCITEPTFSRMSYQVREVAVPKHLHEEANVAFYGDELVYFDATPVAVLGSEAFRPLLSVRKR